MDGTGGAFHSLEVRWAMGQQTRMLCISQAPGETDAGSPEMYEPMLVGRGRASRLSSSAVSATLGTFLKDLWREQPKHNFQ